MYFYIHLAFADLLMGLSLSFHIALYLMPWLWGSTRICIARYECMSFVERGGVMVRVSDSGSTVREFGSRSDHYITTLRPLGKALTTNVHSVHPAVSGYRLKRHLRMAGPSDLKTVLGFVVSPGSYHREVIVKSCETVVNSDTRL